MTEEETSGFESPRPLLQVFYSSNMIALYSKPEEDSVDHNALLMTIFEVVYDVK